MKQNTIQLESNNAITKLGCYGMISISIIICFLILISAEPGQKNSQTLGWILIISLVGVAPPWYYVSTLKRYRITVTDQEFLLEQLPAKVLSRQPMNTLIGWWIANAPGQGNMGQCLHFDFKHSGRIHLQSLEYAGFNELIEFMQTYLMHKKRY